MTIKFKLQARQTKVPIHTPLSLYIYIKRQSEALVLWQLYPLPACSLLFSTSFGLFFFFLSAARRTDSILNGAVLAPRCDFPPDSSARYYQVKPGGAAVLASRRHQTAETRTIAAHRENKRGLWRASRSSYLRHLLPLLHPDGQIGISGADCYRIIVSHFECLTQLRCACHFLPKPWTPSTPPPPCSDSRDSPRLATFHLSLSLSPRSRHLCSQGKVTLIAPFHHPYRHTTIYKLDKPSSGRASER